jgi:L-lactate dehydrogenase complex protein LldE
MQKASLFVPCLVDLLLPEIAIDTLRLLHSVGVEADIPKTPGCCGQPFLNAGLTKKARKLARGVIESLQNRKPILVPSGSCAETIKLRYPPLFEDDPTMQKKAIDLAQRTFELSSYLVDELSIEGIGPKDAGQALFRPSCRALRGLGVRSQPLALMSSPEGSRVSEIESAEACCGFGGAFSARFPEISEAMAHSRIEPFLLSDARVLVVIEPGCLMHLSRALGSHETKRIVHLSSFLSGVRP